MKRLLLATFSVPFFALFSYTVPASAQNNLQNCYTIVNAYHANPRGMARINGTRPYYHCLNLINRHLYRRQRRIDNMRRYSGRMYKYHRLKACRQGCLLGPDNQYNACILGCHSFQ